MHYTNIKKSFKLTVTLEELSIKIVKIQQVGIACSITLSLNEVFFS